MDLMMNLIEYRVVERIASIEPMRVFTKVWSAIVVARWIVAGLERLSRRRGDAFDPRN